MSFGVLAALVSVASGLVFAGCVYVSMRTAVQAGARRRTSRRSKAPTRSYASISGRRRSSDDVSGSGFSARGL